MKAIHMPLVFTLFLLFAFPLIPGSVLADVKFEYKHAFTGVKMCKMCHSKPDLGNQYAVWAKTRHASAFKTLGTADAKKMASKLGVSDPQKADECLVCHVTAFKAPNKLSKKVKPSDGIQCERCHGPGGKYGKKMKQIAKERKASKDGSSKTAMQTGLMIPDETTCLECHSPEITVDGKKYVNPAYKPFDYKTFFPKVSHLRK